MELGIILILFSLNILQLYCNLKSRNKAKLYNLFKPEYDKFRKQRDIRNRYQREYYHRKRNQNGNE